MVVFLFYIRHHLVYTNTSKKKYGGDSIGELQFEQVRKILQELIESKSFIKTAKALSELAAVEAAELLEELVENPAEILIIFRLLPKDFSAEVFAFLEPEQQESVASAVSDEELKHLINELAFDDKIDFFEEMPANLVTKMLSLTNIQERKLVNQFLNYPESSAGSLMTIEFVELVEDMTVKEALRHIRNVGEDMETIYTIFVKSKNRKLSGVVSLRELVIADEKAIIKDICHDNVIYAYTTDDQEEVAEMFKRYDFITIPVVDNEQRLVGIITVDDILDVVDVENTEDFHKMAGILPLEEEYGKTSIFNEAKSRFLWLLILMIGATFTGSIIQRYEEVLVSVVILSSFIPMLMDTAGNAGAQSSTVVIRSLSLGTVDVKDFFVIVWKEFRVSLLVGLFLSVINYLRIVFLLRMDAMVGLVVSLTLFLVILMAKTLGGILPVVAKTIGIDPAVMASPLITTIVDTLALIAYFQIATHLLAI
jgi:magnesium transporter